MKRMFLDILHTLEGALPIGVLISAALMIAEYLAEKIIFKLRASFGKFLLQNAAKALLYIYAYIIIHRTLLGRYAKIDPLSDVLGGWKIYMTQYCGLDYQVIGNIIMFIPLGLLLALSFYRRKGGGKIIALCAVHSFSFSVFIEATQLVFSLGTFQLSDMVYNTVGGIIGAGLYIAAEKLTAKKQKS